MDPFHPKILLLKVSFGNKGHSLFLFCKITLFVFHITPTAPHPFIFVCSRYPMKIVLSPNYISWARDPEQTIIANTPNFLVDPYANTIFKNKELKLLFPPKQLRLSCVI